MRLPAIVVGFVAGTLALTPACTRARDVAVTPTAVTPTATPTAFPTLAVSPTPLPVATPTPVVVDRSGISTPLPVLATPRAALPAASTPPIGTPPTAGPGPSVPTATPAPVVPTPTPKPGVTLVDVARATPSLSRFVAAMEASGLGSTLAGDGPLTLFAPSNAAFDAMPTGSLQALLAPAGKGRLTQILSYHVLQGAYTAERLRDGRYGTLEGLELAIAKPTAGGVKADGAAVLEADKPADNGVLHVIDRVLVPADLQPEADSVPAVVAGRPELKVLTRMLDVTGLAPVLRQPGPYTLFAPLDAAWDKLPAGRKDALLRTENAAKLKALLLYHVSPGRFPAAKLRDQGLPTLNGAGLGVLVAGMPAPRVGGATIALADAFAGNGVVHLLDGVCVPPGFVFPE